MPTGGPVGQAVFDHQTYRHLDDAMRVMASRWGEIAQGGAEVLPALRAVVVRIRHQKVARTTRVQIPKIVQGALPVFVARRRMATCWAGLSLVIRAEQHDRGRREVLDVGDAFGGIWHLFARSEHDLLSLAKGLGPGV